MEAIIYKATNLKNNKSYIGQTHLHLARRISLHIQAMSNNSNSIFHRALNKYSPENFSWIILCSCDNNKELNKKEIYYIKYLNTLVPFGYNIRVGGNNMDKENNPMFGKKQSTKCKEINRQLRLGKSMLEKTKKKISIKLKGRKCSELSKKISSERLKQYPLLKLYNLFIKIPNGKILLIPNLKIFCNKNNLNYNSFRNGIYTWGHYGKKTYILVKKEKI
jgi:group I intron endonuclease